MQTQIIDQAFLQFWVRFCSQMPHEEFWINHTKHHLLKFGPLKYFC